MTIKSGLGGLLLAVLTVLPALSADLYRTGISAQSLRQEPVPRTFKVEFQSFPDATDQMRAIFHEELQKRGFRLDEIGSTVMIVRWDGQFREIETPPRVQAQGRGGNQSRTELGFSITLGAPPAKEGEETYSMGASISDPDGEIWKGKVIVVTESQRKTAILRNLIGKLLDTIGSTISTDSVRQ
ncbi:hypothetical protein [Minwuia sp.]|uniref:hypothetical protein n=1 Tax=Minwuia sp. TaxID=2493630 RepID=UPI003A938EF0